MFSFETIINNTKLNISQQKSAIKEAELLVSNQTKLFNESVNAIQRYIKMYSNKEIKGKGV